MIKLLRFEIFELHTIVKIETRAGARMHFHLTLNFDFVKPLCKFYKNRSKCILMRWIKEL